MEDREIVRKAYAPDGNSSKLRELGLLDIPIVEVDGRTYGLIIDAIRRGREADYTMSSLLPSGYATLKGQLYQAGSGNVLIGAVFPTDSDEGPRVTCLSARSQEDLGRLERECGFASERHNGPRQLHLGHGVLDAE